MSGTWGNRIKLTIFGESHGKAIGVILDGLKPGTPIDRNYIDKELQRRSPGKSPLSTSRIEKDDYELLSGCFNEKATGTPLCAVIYNTDVKSEDYKKLRYLPRPSHGDYPGYIKYKGFNDYRGGGHFSGRLTAPLVLAGAICKKVLGDMGITIGSHIKSIAHIQDGDFDKAAINADMLNKLNTMSFPLLSTDKESVMKKIMLESKNSDDSVGGTVETAAVGIKPGIGEPFFDSVESTLSHIIFSIPGVKGLEFGAGFEISKMKGSQANDEYFIKNNRIKTYSNNNGGIAGGLTTGMPLIFRTAIRPTPSIGKKQKTIDMENMANTDIEIIGRHDSCIVPRALPVIEAVTAIALLDLMI